MKNLDKALKNVDIYPGSPIIRNFSPTWTGEIASNKCSEFIYCLEGGFVCTVGAHNYLVKPGQMVLMPQGISHACWSLPAVPAKCIFFSFRVLCEGEDLFSRLGMTSDGHVIDLPREAVLQCCKAMTDSPLSTDKVPFYLMLSAQLSIVIAMYVKARIASENATTAFSKVIAFMQAHITEDVSLEQLAGLFHWHPDYFSRKFKENVGVSPIRYFAEMRASHAANLLLTTHLSIEEVAKTVGFSNIYYFRSFFLKHIGIRPEAYKKAFQKPSDLTLCI